MARQPFDLSQNTRINAFLHLALDIIGSFTGLFTADKAGYLLKDRFAANPDPARCLFLTSHRSSATPEKHAFFGV
jgi:hypothetical protein